MSAPDLFAAARRRSAQLIETDPQVQRAQPSHEVLAVLEEEHACIEYLAAACRQYADRPCLSERELEWVPGPDGELVAHYLPRFRAITFGELWQRATALASAWSQKGLVRKGDFVGLCGFASIDWVVADMACLLLEAVSVPLQANTSVDDLGFILHETQLRCLVVSAEHVMLARALLEPDSSVKSVIAIDLDAVPTAARDAAVASLAEDGRVAYAIREVERWGAGGERPPRDAPPAAGDDPLVTISYTSGTTGRPKGVMYPRSLWLSRLRHALDPPRIPLVTVGYLPLGHVVGRLTVYRTMMCGGSTAFVAKSDMSTVFEDFKLVRPTMLTTTPRLTTSLYQHFQTELTKRGRTAGSAELAKLRDTILAEMRENLLGGRLCLVITGSAPTAPEVLEFLELCADCSLVVEFGFSEVGLVTLNNWVAPGVIYKLVDAPELGYTTSDRPYPRGRLAVKATHSTPGYFKSAGASRSLRDAEGYVVSGDIMEEREPGYLVWIDRASEVLKLSQGEFVNVARLELVFTAGSPFIEQIYIYGNSSRSFLLAVVVPNFESAGVELEKRGRRADDHAALKQLLRQELDRVAQAAQLASHEVPRELLVEHERFSKESGLLTELNKPKRPRLKEKYGPSLEALYRAIDKRVSTGPMAIEPSATLPDQVAAAVAASLGIPVAEVDVEHRSFTAMGGDSFTAVRLSALLEESCGVPVPVGLLLDRSNRLRDVVDRIERLKREERVTVETIHGKGASELVASELRIDRFLKPEISRATPPAPPQVVLLTGASGFLGRFLLLELLARVGARGGRVVCFVRGADDERAAERLRASFSGGDPALIAQLDTLSGKGLSVRAGDLMQPKLGLAPATYDALSAEVDAVVHAGALVNHALSYAQLFEPNVLGTVEVMRFAARGRPKAISYVSSSGVAVGLGRTAPIEEREAAAELAPRRPAGGSGAEYGVGYGATKWASEVLLSDFHERTGIPVNVFRSSMVLAHRVYREINATDQITRLLAGVLDTGLAPRSFYAPGYAGERHFDGTPVDLVAHGIAAIAMEAPRGFRTFHVSNPHWGDGVSLDRLVGWIESSGRKLTWVDDYREWFAAFRRRLEALDPRRRARSPLPILDRWAQPMAERPLRLDTTAYEKELSRLTGQRIPSLNEAFLHHCLRAIERE